jgi:hypothetical protein
VSTGCSATPRSEARGAAGYAASSSRSSGAAGSRSRTIRSTIAASNSTIATPVSRVSSTITPATQTPAARKKSVTCQAVIRRAPFPCGPGPLRISTLRWGCGNAGSRRSVAASPHAAAPARQARCRRRSVPLTRSPNRASPSSWFRTTRPAHRLHSAGERDPAPDPWSAADTPRWKCSSTPRTLGTSDAVVHPLSATRCSRRRVGT